MASNAPNASLELLQSNSAADVAIVRGARTRTTVGTVQLLASSHSTVYVLWDHKQRKDSEGTDLTTTLFKIGQGLELFGDERVNKRAMVHLPQAPLRCLLLHACAEETGPENLPCETTGETIKAMSEGHLETRKALIPVGAYMQYVLTLEASVFFLLFNGNAISAGAHVGQAANQTARLVDSLTHGHYTWQNGTPCTFGMMALYNSPGLNALLAYQGMKRIVDAPAQLKHELGSALISLSKPPDAKSPQSEDEGAEHKEGKRERLVDGFADMMSGCLPKFCAIKNEGAS